jgi:hypothetical protein
LLPTPKTFNGNHESPLIDGYAPTTITITITTTKKKERMGLGKTPNGVNSERLLLVIFVIAI